MADDIFSFQEQDDFAGKKVKILGPTYEPGRPDAPYHWRDKLPARADKLQYLKSGERYFFSPEGYGSEKRKHPA